MTRMWLEPYAYAFVEWGQHKGTLAYRFYQWTLR